MKNVRPGSPASTTSSDSDRSASTTFPEIKRLKKKYFSDESDTVASGSSVSSSSIESEDYEDDAEDVKSRLERKLQSYCTVHEQLVKVQPLLESIAAKAIFVHDAEMRANWIGRTTQLARLEDAEISVDAQRILTSVKTKHGILQITQIFGSGNNGTAYGAIDENGNVLVLKAINMSRASLRELTARALRESESMNNNDVESQVFFDKTSEQLFVSMPFYKGKSVKEELSVLSDKILEAQEKGHSREALHLMRNMFEILSAMLKAVDQLHANTGLVHADAWVDNFRVIQNVDGKYEVKVLDYGGCCESGITSDGYFSQHLQYGDGDYHTSPEIPNKTNRLFVVNEKFSELQNELLDKKQQVLHAKNGTEKRAAKAELKKVESEISKVEAFFRFQKIEKQLQRSKFKHPKNAAEKRILEEELQDKKDAMAGIEHIMPSIFKSYREYAAEINAKSDLHAIMASSVFEGMINLFSGVWPVESISDENPEIVQNVIADFMRWAMQYGCNSDWFFSRILLSIPQAKCFIDEVVAKRDQEMAENGWTVSNQARVDIVSAIDVVERFIARTESIMKKSPQVSVATRVKKFEASISHV